MTYVAITSDLHGYIFSVDHVGDLYRNRETSSPGGQLAFPGLGERIGSGWQGINHIAATWVSGQFVVAATHPNGNLVSASTPLSVVDEWSDVAPVSAHVSWGDILQLTGGLDGAVFAVTRDGQLRRHSFTVAAPGQVIVNPAFIVGSDWATGDGHARLVLTTNGTRFFDITLEGSLRYQHHSVNADEIRNDAWDVVSTGWTKYQRTFAGGPDYLYAITSEGAVVVHRFQVEGDTVRMLPRTAADTIGTGVVGWKVLPCAVEGYATPQSVRPGETVTFHTAATHSFAPVDPLSTPYTVEYLRLHRMDDGKAGRSEIIARDHRTFRTETRTIPLDWLRDGMDWPVTFEFQVPANTPTGMYAARCVDVSGVNFYIPFIVRPPRRSAPFAVLANTNTWNAYNSWGGSGKYVHHVPLPHHIPFERPHPGLTPEVPSQVPSNELFNQSCHLLRAELWVLGWLDSLGKEYAYDLYTDRDLHNGIPELTDLNPDVRYKALILTVHPEYWTEEMCVAATTYQQLGGTIIYLGGNGLYEQVVFQPSGVGLTIFPGVDWSKISPKATNAEVRVQCLWRNRGRPERATIGVGFEDIDGLPVAGYPYTLALEPSMSPALAGLDLLLGAKLGATSANPGHAADGWEVDVRGPDSPAAAMGPTARLADGVEGHEGGEMIFYQTGYGSGMVFSASSLDFGGALAMDPHLQRIVRNVMTMALTATAIT